MISSFRNFAKTKFAGLLVFIMIIPFVFWGMGSMFSSGNSNNIAKINNTNISTQDFIDHIKQLNIPEKTIRDNLDKNIIEELLSTLISRTLLDLEIQDFEIIVSKESLSKMIKANKNFHDKDGNFERIKYEKFLLENNQSAPSFESRLKSRELQKNLFEYVGAGTISPKYLVNRLFEEENKKLNLEFIDLKSFYKKKGDFTEKDLNNFIKQNKEQLKIDYLNFKYAIINPSNLIGVNEFNQSFFDKIDQIEIDIANNIKFETILSNFNIIPLIIKDFKYSENKSEIEKKIFQLKENNFDIFEHGNDYILYKIENIEQKEPNLNDLETKDEIIELISQKNKFDYNNELLKKIRNKEFQDNDFLKMGQDKIQEIKINSIKDNKKFDINAIEILYSLPENSYTLINDDKNNIYLAKIKKFENVYINNDNQLNEYIDKQNSKIKNSMLKSYDSYLNKKYEVILNQKTIERVKNFFQ